MSAISTYSYPDNNQVVPAMPLVSGAGMGNIPGDRGSRVSASVPLAAISSQPHVDMYAPQSKWFNYDSRTAQSPEPNLEAQSKRLVSATKTAGAVGAAGASAFSAASFSAVGAGGDICYHRMNPQTSGMMPPVNFSARQQEGNIGGGFCAQTAPGAEASVMSRSAALGAGVQIAAMPPVGVALTGVQPAPEQAAVIPSSSLQSAVMPDTKIPPYHNDPMSYQKQARLNLNSMSGSRGNNRVSTGTGEFVITVPEDVGAGGAGGSTSAGACYETAHNNSPQSDNAPDANYRQMPRRAQMTGQILSSMPGDGARVRTAGADAGTGAGAVMEAGAGMDTGTGVRADRDKVMRGLVGKKQGFPFSDQVNILNHPHHNHEVSINRAAIPYSSYHNYDNQMAHASAERACQSHELNATVISNRLKSSAAQSLMSEDALPLLAQMSIYPATTTQSINSTENTSIREHQALQHDSSSRQTSGIRPLNPATPHTVKNDTNLVSEQEQPRLREAERIDPQEVESYITGLNKTLGEMARGRFADKAGSTRTENIETEAVVARDIAVETKSAPPESAPPEIAASASVEHKTVETTAATTGAESRVTETCISGAEVEIEAADKTSIDGAITKSTETATPDTAELIEETGTTMTAGAAVIPGAGPRPGAGPEPGGETRGLRPAVKDAYGSSAEADAENITLRTIDLDQAFAPYLKQNLSGDRQLWSALAQELGAEQGKSRLGTASKAATGTGAGVEADVFAGTDVSALAGAAGTVGMVPELAGTVMPFVREQRLGRMELPVVHPEFGQMVPELCTSYVFEPDHLKEILMFLKHPEHDSLYISGPTGCGKTSGILQIAAVLQWPVESVTLSQRSEIADLIGANTLIQGQIVYQYGPLTRAMLKGGILLLNEIDLLPAGELAALNDVLEGRALTITANHGEVIKPHPFFRVIATANSKGNGDDSGFYLGVRNQNQAFLDRWRFVEFNYPDQFRECSMILRERPQLNPDFVRLILRFAADIRLGLAHMDHNNGGILRRMQQQEWLQLSDTLKGQGSATKGQVSATETAVLPPGLSMQELLALGRNSSYSDNGTNIFEPDILLKQPELKEIAALLNKSNSRLTTGHLLKVLEQLEAKAGAAEADKRSQSDAMTNLILVSLLGGFGNEAPSPVENSTAQKRTGTNGTGRHNAQNTESNWVMEEDDDTSECFNTLSAPFSTRALLRICRMYADHSNLTVQEAIALGFASRLPGSEYEYVMRLSYDLFGYRSNFNMLPHQIGHLSDYLRLREQIMQLSTCHSSLSQQYGPENEMELEEQQKRKSTRKKTTTAARSKKQ